MGTLTPDRPATLDLYAELKKLYKEVVETRTDYNSPYIQSHSKQNSIRRQIDIFNRYRPFLPEAGRLLDWGCAHAPDACLIRATVGDHLELHGCDFRPAGAHEIFHKYAKMAYKELDHTFKLPYEDRYFTVVLGSGVLEHTAMDNESLKEIYRVLENRGIFIITFLPNTLSFSEFISRLRDKDFHKRIYSRKEILNQLKHHGFQPLMSGYHQFMPAQQFQTILGPLWFMNSTLERTWPFKLFCANVMVIARKVRWF